MERLHEEVLNETLETQRDLLKAEKKFEVSAGIKNKNKKLNKIVVFRNGDRGRRRRRPRRRSK